MVAIVTHHRDQECEEVPNESIVVVLISLLGSPTGPTLARAALVLSFVAFMTLGSFPFGKDLLPFLL